MSDSNGYIYDADGINLDTVKLIKEVNRGRISEYINSHPKAEYFPDVTVYGVYHDIAFTLRHQNELDSEGARLLIKNGCMAVGEEPICRLPRKQLRY